MDDLWKDRRGVPLCCFLAVENEEPVGLASVTADGRISYWHLDPGAPVEAARGLLAAVELSARSAGATELHFFTAGGRSDADESLIVAGFRSVPAPCTTLRVLDFPALLRRLAESAPSAPPRAPFAIQICFGPDRFRREPLPDLFLSARDHRWWVEESRPSTVNACVKCSAGDLTGLLFGEPSDRSGWSPPMKQVAP